MAVKSFLLSSLSKVFLDEITGKVPQSNKITALKNETVSYQIAYLSDEDITCKLSVQSDYSDCVRVRTVEMVQVDYVARQQDYEGDKNYIRTSPGLYPDILRDIPDCKLELKKGEYRTIWVDFETTQKVAQGDTVIKISLKNQNGEVLDETEQQITVFDVTLPKGKLIHTQWFHSDCIADYYGIEVFSEEYWQAVEKFMLAATKRGQNMILTPIFTPPLDTEVGGERTTVQLIDVFCDKKKWSFGYDKFVRWIELAKKCGFEYYEISHLFTQWGSVAAPKVMATVDGKEQRVFGWDTTVKEGKYTKFLSKFLPDFIKQLKKMQILDKCYFHISDEPNHKNIKNYKRAKKSVWKYLGKCNVMDALSDYEFYKKKVAKLPIPGTDRIQVFIDHKVPNLWSYYCCGQVHQSNIFIAMSQSSSRAIGVQWFKHKIVGFLHWGYNYYNSLRSHTHIDPYLHTDGGDGKDNAPCYPAGDPFLVYPGKCFEPEESIRWMALYEAQTDLRALQALQEKTSYEHVMEIVESELGYPITFDKYPLDEDYYISLRNRVNEELNKF